VDQDGVVLDILVQERRDGKAAKMQRFKSLKQRRPSFLLTPSSMVTSIRAAISSQPTHTARLRRGSRCVEIRLSPELIDALGNSHHVRLLFARVRGEFLLDRFRRNSCRCNRMLSVSQHADDFRRQH
jgi:hypothetical protein